MRYFPVFMDLWDQPVVLVGAGSVAERKARLLLKAGARLRLVARELNPQFSRWLEAGTVQHLASEYQAAVLHDARLVFAATSDGALNRRVFSDAEALGIPANVVDDRAHCRFISPALVDRSPVQIAISTGGCSPVLARRIRSWIETILPLGLGRVAEAASGLRSEVNRRLPRAQHRSFWERLLSERQLRSWALQSGSDIEHRMRKELEQAANADKRRKPAAGRVYLVGAGPGRADLLTLRALQVLAQADVVLHDSLVSEAVLDLVRRDADRIDVGKRAGRHRHDQQEIHDLLAREASKGRIVVRLKGGDSFIFGRGGEELEHLHALGIDYEVVPGVTAATGCAAFAGIPLTHRDHAQALTLVTGHRGEATGVKPAGREVPVDWAGIAGPGRTVVVYMGVRKAAAIRGELLQAGVDAELPVALVVNGTLDSQRVLHGTVDGLPQLAARAGADAPGLLIIGQVASLGVNLAWFNAQEALQSAA